MVIKLEFNGPVLYSSKRVGKGYRIFNLYKFRSGGSGGEDAGSGTTAFGRFLRNTHLNEVPQLINVILGDMSLVGNSPIPAGDAETLTRDEIAWRFLAPAGIIGLWRLHHVEENNMATGDCVRLDMEYAMTNSPWLDIRILYYYVHGMVTRAKQRTFVPGYSPTQLLHSS
jgi:lipopolysaccharide/colanic/teichoic acid biosynthesis glycosyltransferase